MVVNVKDVSEVKIQETNKSTNTITGKFSNLFKSKESPDKLKEFKQETVIKESTKFQLKGKPHMLSVEEVREDSVTLKITSDPVIVVLFLNDVKEVDIDNDKVNDLRLTLDSIENGIPIIKVVETSTNAVAETNEPGFFSKYRNWIIGAIIVIILIILASIFLSEDEDEKETKEEPEEEKIKVGRYVLVVIALGIIAWLLSKYGLLIQIGLYKYYIILGLLVLLILVVIIKYWEEISSFFEEEIEEEKKTENHKEEKHPIKKEAKEVKEKKTVKK